jgi:hypothetical protein
MQSVQTAGWHFIRCSALLKELDWVLEDAAQIRLPYSCYPEDIKVQRLNAPCQHNVLHAHKIPMPNLHFHSGFNDCAQSPGYESMTNT